jgi:hypothetical protein
MHTYDSDRHVWRYDIGGFAWDNSELSPDLWLWTQALRTGAAQPWRLAEAMTRHTSEVDTYHMGRFVALAPATGAALGRQFETAARFQRHLSPDLLLPHRR